MRDLGQNYNKKLIQTKMRYMVKGGVWKNTEDEILKSAVMKYGLNQWSRISSLLVQKSAKECKARWYEWLDPSIKKTEWTREEEEKLLHLAKIFPTQWRTIAPVIGRTPAQCIEKYENLLDKASGRDELDPNDPRRLRPGEIDPNPETKASRPDPVDMDEEDKEMLQECRARLANTKGKKAKRKQREKMLEEARRVSQLQKVRELKQAGIDVYKPLKIKGVDYNKEIPFEQQVPIGRHIPASSETPEADAAASNKALRMMETKLRDEEERKQRILDQKRLNKLKQKNLPKAIEEVNKANASTLLQFNTKMSLPAPQISQKELEDVSKYANGGLQLQDQAETSYLTGEYSQRDMMTPAHQMQTPKISERILKGAQDAIAHQQQQTPLIGGNNPNLTEQNNFQTPSLGKRASSNQSVDFAQPDSKRPKLVVATPLRDQMKLNDMDAAFGETWEKSSIASSVFDQKSTAFDIMGALSSLPAPKNEFKVTKEQIQLMESDIDMQEEETKQKKVADTAEIDQEEKLEQEALEQQEQKERERQLMSSVLRQGLPRPTIITKEMFEGATSSAEELVLQQMFALIANDNRKHPAKGMKSKNLPKEAPPVGEFSLSQMQQARQMIENEVKYNQAHVETQEWPQLEQDPKTDEQLKQELQNTQQLVDKENKRCAKIQSALDIMFQKYEERAQGQQAQIQKLDQEKAQLLIEKNVFSLLRQQEEKSIQYRYEDMEKQLVRLSKIENELQNKYQNLRDELERHYQSEKKAAKQ